MEKQLTTETRTEILKADNLMILILSLILSFFLFLSIHVLVYKEIPDFFVWLLLAGGFVMSTAIFLHLLIASIRYNRPFLEIIECLFALLISVGFCYLFYTCYRQIE